MEGLAAARPRGKRTTSERSSLHRLVASHLLSGGSAVSGISWPRGMVVRGRARTLSRTATVLRCRAAGAAFGARLAVERGGGSVVGEARRLSRLRAWQFSHRAGAVGDSGATSYRSLCPDLTLSSLAALILGRVLCFSSLVALFLGRVLCSRWGPCRAVGQSEGLYGYMSACPVLPSLSDCDRSFARRRLPRFHCSAHRGLVL